MKHFAQLFAELDASTATSAKVDALKRYFAARRAADAAWAVYFLAGGKPRQVVPTALLRALACRRAGIADWLFDECYQAVGDLAETIAHVLPPAAQHERRRPGRLGRGAPAAAARRCRPTSRPQRIAGYWDELDTAGRFLLTKLIGGGFRVGVSKLLVQRALAEAAGIDAKLVAQRMMGYTDAQRDARRARAIAQLIAPSDAGGRADAGQPYPFFLAHAARRAARRVRRRGSAPPADWLVEWKYDGIRAQVVRRAGQVWIWSRGEELVTERFPEIVALAQRAARRHRARRRDRRLAGRPAPAPFNLLQQRIGRKTLTKKVLADAPVGFIAYDLLEWQRRRPARAAAARAPRACSKRCAARDAPRAAALAASQQRATTGPALAALREESRARGVEGFMLKHRDARYGTGRDAGGRRHLVEVEDRPAAASTAVLIYAQAGHGRRASVYTDYTFAVWNRTPARRRRGAGGGRRDRAARAAAPDALQLVPFAKAYSGLTDEEFRDVDRVIRATTLEKFGPVRSVKPTLVFELGFEGINRSPRHKSGIAVRFPRMLRIRDDKPLHEADTLQTLEALLAHARPRARRLRLDAFGAISAGAAPARSRSARSRADLDAVPVAQRHVAQLAHERRPRSSSRPTKASITAAIATSAARALLPSSILIATPRPRSGSAAQKTPSAPTLQKTRSPRRSITRVSKRPVPATMNGAARPPARSRAAARAWPGRRPTPVPTRAKASARWRSGIAKVGIEQPSMPRGAAREVEAGRGLQRRGDLAHHRVVGLDVAARVLAQVDAVAQHAGQAEKAGVLARAVVVQRARLAPGRGERARDRLDVRPVRAAFERARRRGRPSPACARRRRRARARRCARRRRAPAPRRRGRARSAAPLATSGSACSTLTAERGKIGRSMSPSATTHAAVGIDAPRSRRDGPIRRCSPRITSTRIGFIGSIPSRGSPDSL